MGQKGCVSICRTNMDHVHKLAVIFVLAQALSHAFYFQRPLAEQGRSQGSLPRKYPKFPLFRQCDPKWAKDLMGLKNCSVETCSGSSRGRDTICDQGCAMSSLSMALNGFGYKIDSKETIDPATLNDWLVNNVGYECSAGDCNKLNLAQMHTLNSSVNFIGDFPTSKIGIDGMLRYISEELIILAHVHDRTHWVLVDTYDQKGEFQVLDPYYNTTRYNFTSISDILVYKM